MLRRYENRSTIMTSNRPLEDWGKLLNDVPTAGAILDRFHAIVISISGRSYRVNLHFKITHPDAIFIMFFGCKMTMIPRLNPGAGSFDYQSFTKEYRARAKSLLATCLPFLRREPASSQMNPDRKKSFHERDFQIACRCNDPSMHCGWYER
jgi:hypothetical protein